MDLLKRSLAPVASESWVRIDDEASRVLKLHLAGRKLVDFSGPHGWKLGGVNTGNLKRISETSVERVEHAVREVQPLVEIRSHFALDISEIDNAARGAQDLDLGSVIAAAERVALAEDSAIFHGFGPGRMIGIVEASPHPPVNVQSNLQWPRSVSAARELLRLAGVNGPYALAVGSRSYDELSADGEDGYPIRKRIEETIVDGSIIWAPALREGAVFMSLRGSDYELVVGQDFSIGYAHHDQAKVELYLTESFAFRVLENRAAVSLLRNFDDA